MATLSPAATLLGSGGASCSARVVRKAGVRYVGGLSTFGGLKAHDDAVASLGLPDCADRSFARVVAGALRYSASRRRGSKGKGGGALSSTCNAAAEIFQIAAIINGLVLVGVAVGFVILRVEATLEETE